MYEAWSNERKKKMAYKEVIQSMIEDNWAAVEEHVIDFMCEATDGDQLVEQLEVLRQRRKHLFDLRDDLEEMIAWYTQSMEEVKSTEFPNGLPDELKEEDK